MPGRKIPPAHRRRINQNGPSQGWLAARADMAVARAYGKALISERAAHEKTRRQLARRLRHERRDARLEEHRRLVLLIIRTIVCFRTLRQKSIGALEREAIIDRCAARLPQALVYRFPATSGEIVALVARRLERALDSGFSIEQR